MEHGEVIYTSIVQTQWPNILGKGCFSFVKLRSSLPRWCTCEQWSWNILWCHSLCPKVLQNYETLGSPTMAQSRGCLGQAVCLCGGLCWSIKFVLLRVLSIYAYMYLSDTKFLTVVKAVLWKVKIRSTWTTELHLCIWQKFPQRSFHFRQRKVDFISLKWSIKKIQNIMSTHPAFA